MVDEFDIQTVVNQITALTQSIGWMLKASKGAPFWDRMTGGC